MWAVLTICQAHSVRTMAHSSGQAVYGSQRLTPSSQADLDPLRADCRTLGKFENHSVVTDHKGSAGALPSSLRAIVLRGLGNEGTKVFFYTTNSFQQNGAQLPPSPQPLQGRQQSTQRKSHLPIPNCRTQCPSLHSQTF